MAFIDRLIGAPRVVLFVMALVVLFGLMAQNNLPIEMEPNIDVPVALVIVRHEGISPEDGARLLVRPIEKEIKTLEGLDEVNASAREGAVYIIVKFDVAVDTKKALSDLRDAVDRARAEFPADTDEPLVSEISIQPPEVVITFSGDAASQRELIRIAKYFQRKIEKLPDVLEAKLTGHREEVVEIVLKPERLQQFRITFDEVVRSVNANNLIIPAGEMDSGAGRFSVKVPALIETEADIRGLPIRSTAEGVITLSDIALIRRTFKDARGFSLFNGVSTTAIDVKKRNGANSIETVQAVRDLIEHDRASFSQEIAIDFIFDTAPYAKSLVSELSGNILTAMSLVFILVVATLGVRSGLLVAFGVPFCLLGALIVISFLGYSYNFVVMFGLLLSLGMLIDGAIVVVEFADAKMAEGASAKEAYGLGVKRMGLPVAASIGTTLAAFSPLLFWPGTTGKFMAYMPVTVFAVLLWSLLYALVFAPTLGVAMSKVQSKESIALTPTSAPAVGIRFFSFISRQYLLLLSIAIRHPLKNTLIALTFLSAVFMGYSKFGAGVAFFTDSENQFGTVIVRAQGNFSVMQKRQLTEQVQTRIRAFNEVRQLHVSSDETWVVAKDTSRDQISVFYVELLPSNERERSSREVFSAIQQATENVPGILVSAKNVENGPPVGKDLQIQISSTDRASMYQTSAFIRQWIDKNIAGLRDLEDTMPLPGVQWEMHVDRSKAAMSGVSVATVGQAVQLVTNGLVVGQFRPNDADEEIEIRLRYPARLRHLSALDELFVESAAGSVPVSHFTQRLPAPRVDVIQRLDMQESVMVMAFTEEGYLIDDQTRQISAWLKTQNFPADVEVRLRGANEEQAKSASFLLTAFTLAMGLMLVMMLAQFNSFYQAFLILFAVVLSTAGVMLGLLLTKGIFSITLTGIGIVALAGIVVNNNIVLIHTYNFIRASQPELSLETAIYEAAKSRWRPIMLTSITTIVGLLPLANGISVDIVNRTWEEHGMIVSWWQPLASTIVNGLTVSTVMTLLLTPTLLMVPSALKSRFKAMWSSSSGS